MKKFFSLSCILLIIFLALFISGCGGSYQARNVELGSTVLVNPRVLKEGSDDQALYRYKNPNVNWTRYNQVLIDPILILKDAELDADELANYERLANNGYVYLSQELQKNFQLVRSAAPGTLRVQMAILDADTSKPVRTILSFTPIGMGLNVLKYAATGKQSAVGEITAELKITDAQTGQLLGAALDRRVGGKNPKDIYDVWYNADNSLQYWAKKMAFVLCKQSGKGNCVSPD